MAFILAPYNNAMRLGQGFNTFTQQICIDDAVVVDPARAENVLANDGSTMRIMVQSMGRPSAWSRQKEVVEDNAYKAVEKLEGSDNTGSTAERHSEQLENEFNDGNVSTDKDASQDDAEILDTSGIKTPATDDKDIESENGSGDVVVEKSTGSVAEQDSKSRASEEKLDETEPSVEPEIMPTNKSKVSASKSKASARKSKASASRKFAAGVRSNAAAKAIAGSKPAPYEPKPTVAGRGKTPAKTNKPEKDATNWELYATQGTENIDWDQYRSQHVGDEVDEEEKAALLEEERERQREERELRKERERERREEEKEKRRQERELRKEIEKERWEEERQLRAEERKQRQEDAAWKREHEKQRRDEQKANVEWATSGSSPEERAAMKKEVDVAFEQRFKGMLENKKDMDFDEDPTTGPSQIVTYTSRFIDKLSDITDDMNISGSLSIKAGKIGGSGRGAFINTDKFKESDLNFYISVKVVNQTINFKDALVYNPVRSVNKENFNAVFGDGFISGFQEGGEFNALISMKILNKAKKTDIQAEAKVAFTTGSIDVKAEANVNIAKANIETNTETTIQVSWSGGGHIKPREQQWDIQSLMQAAARFPDLVARCPQRIYAIITKYDNLRSFVKTKPAGYTKLQYENAQMYTNSLMDAYMSYKSLYTKVGTNIFDIQNKTKRFRVLEDISTVAESETIASMAVTKTIVGDQKLKEGAPIHDSFPFSADLAGLAQAKKDIRRQMALIVNEVDLIEQDPKKATDDDHFEPFQDPAAFETRLPIVELPQSAKPTMPLSGKRIMAKTETEDEQTQVEEDATPSSLLPDTSSLIAEEQSALERFLAERPSLAKNLQLTPPMGSQTGGLLFNNLEFVQPQWTITKISIEIHNGAISELCVHYDNGLVLSRGEGKGGQKFQMTNFQKGERIVSVSIQIGKSKTDSTDHKVIALQMHTNRGRSLIGQAAVCLYDKESGDHTRDGIVYTDVHTKYFDGPLKDANLKGFYGRADDKAVWRLGLIWGDLGRDEGYDGTTQSTEVNDSVDLITQAKSESASLKIEIDNLKRTVSTQAQEVNSLSNSALSWGGRDEAFRRGRVQIYFILYGGSEIWDASVASRLIDYATNNQQFRINEDTLRCNPWGGVDKSLHILYRRSHLQKLEAQIGDEGLLVAKHSEMASIIHHSLQPLHRDLTDLKDMMHSHQDCCTRRKQSIHVVDQVRHLVLYKAKLQGFQDKLPTHRESICVIRDLVNASANAGTSEDESENDKEKRAMQRRESVIRLEELVDVYHAQVRKTEGEVKAKGEALRVWEEGLGSDGNGCGCLGNGDVVVGGMSDEEVEEVCHAATVTAVKAGQKVPEFRLNVFE